VAYLAGSFIARDLVLSKDELLMTTKAN